MFPHALMTWTGLSLVLLAVGLAFGNSIMLVGAVFLLLLVLIVATLQPPSGVQVRRRTSRAICWAGDALTIERELTITRGIGPVFVHDALPPELEVEEGNNLRIFWKWAGTRTCVLSYTVRFPKRGRTAHPGHNPAERGPCYNNPDQVPGRPGPDRHVRFGIPRTASVRAGRPH